MFTLIHFLKKDKEVRIMMQRLETSGLQVVVSSQFFLWRNFILLPENSSKQIH